MALLQFSVIPLVGDSVSQYVAKAVDVIDSSGLDYRLHATCTEVEGDLGQLLDLLKQAIDAAGADCDRLSVMVKIDVRKGETGALAARVARVETRLGRQVKK